MKLRVGYWFITFTTIGWYCIFTYTENLKPTITLVKFHTGLYLDQRGQKFFYPTQWKVVTYVDLQPTQLLWKQVKAYQLQIVN